MRKLTNDEFQSMLKMLRDQGKDIHSTSNYINSKTPMWFYCSKGHWWRTRPNNILYNNHECPYCAGKKVWIGFNDLWTTRPDVAKLLKDPNDGYNHTKGSNKKVEFICPHCNSVIEQYIFYVCRNGLSCQMCSDGVSYPNKLIRQVLKQLHVDFIPEYVAEWSQSKMYDCYFKDNNGQEYVIEMDGIQHYVDNCMPHQALKDIQNNDILKTDLANDNGVFMIRINCSTSSIEYIKKNILLSKLNGLFDLSVIDWDACDINAQSSFVKQACDLYMSGICSTKDIGRILQLDKTTVRRYLKRGVKFGWCNYNPKTVHSKPVLAIDN